MKKYNVTDLGNFEEKKQPTFFGLFSKPEIEEITDETIEELTNNKGDDEDE